MIEQIAVVSFVLYPQVSSVTEGFVPQFFNRPSSLARFEIKSSENNWKVT